MDKKRTLLEMQEDIKTIVGSMGITFDSIVDAESKINSYLAAMKHVGQLPDIGSSVGVEKVTDSEEMSAVLKETPTVEIVEDKKAYVFERKLRGGELIGKECYIPEILVREMELEHGDLVYAVDDGVTSSGKPKHKFEVAERRGLPENEDVVIIPYGIVDMDFGNGYFVRKDMTQNDILVNGKVGELKIPEDDVKNFGIQHGDVIDVSYSKAKPDIVRIVWRYDSDFVADFTKPSDTSSKTKEKSKKMYPKTLTGKTVLMVGFEPGRSKMEEEIVSRGGKFQWIHGKKEREVTIRKMIGKADAVILMLEHIGHGGGGCGSKGVVEIAKELGVKHDSMHSFGRSLFVSKVHKCLGIPVEEAIAQ